MLLSASAYLLFWLFDKTPEQLRQETIEANDRVKKEQIMSIWEKIDSDDKIIEKQTKIRDNAQKIVDEADKIIKDASARNNWRERCVMILNQSLWEIDPIDCEMVMQWKTTGTVLQATFQ